MFHNYILSEKAQTYAGVDVSVDEKVKALMRERWTRMAMGILSSQYAKTGMFAWGMEIIIGDRKYEANPFLLGFSGP